ncbi:MAG: hypothetical protein EOO50_11445 [Flavobacterium sp.]|uniref:hypothetical protein n=1 Tax=Flavobacterium sp. TaxID=239 RepID=UPI00120C092F|nr:hypothetical protein [Flavobacterium sp.]RZJ66019.1 MAG: hypothetical protein EOO50_11445 [Flavobacterium sp.]
MDKILTKDEVSEIVNKHYARSGILNTLLSDSTYREYTRIDDSRYSRKEQTHGLTIYESKVPFIMLLTLAAFFLFSFPMFNAGNPTPDFVKILYGISALLIVFSLFKIFFVNKIFMQTTASSFRLKEEREIKWSDVLVTGIYVVRGKSSQDYVILGLNDGEVVKILIEFGSLSARDFIRMIHLNNEQP